MTKKLPTAAEVRGILPLPAEKWKARATELWENCSHSRDLIDSTAAALAEAYAAGEKSKMWPPEDGETGPPVDAATSWNLHYD